MDTKTAGFVVLDVPLRTVMTVRGRVRRSDSETGLDATGASY